MPTVEQATARDAFATGADLALVAGAGTGKTSSLVLMGESTRRNGLYIAFNKAIAEEAKTRFGANVECRTAHSLAHQAVGWRYRERLDASTRIPAHKTAELLGIRRDLALDSRQITTTRQARLVMGMVHRFCFTTDRQIAARHLEPVNGLDEQGREHLAQTLLPYAQRAWEDTCRPDGKLRFEHDHYMKMWALSSPQMEADFLLLDEAQDTNPVLEEVFLAQAAQKVCVGDPAQQIYEWRNAQDVMRGFPADTFHLTQSFRFAPPIAEVANRWLEHAGSSMQLTGYGTAESRVGTVPQPNAVLCRSNADAMQEVLTYLEQDVPVALTGGGEALTRIAQAATDLKAGKRTTHRELFLFQSWREVREYVENDKAGQDLRAIVQLVDAYGPELITSAVRRLSPESRAQVIVSTAHKAKGREWASVRIGQGFTIPPTDDGTQRILPLAEARLIYVAVTRARRELDTTGVAWLDDYEKSVGHHDAAGNELDPRLIHWSLTRQVKDESSPISHFMAKHLPNAHAVVRDYVQRISGLPHPVQPIEVRHPNWSNLGHTIDYRLRLSLDGTLGGAVDDGINLLVTDACLPGAPDPRVRKALVSAGRQLLDQIDAHQAKRLSIETHMLTRLCYIAGFFEDIFRTGHVRPSSPLANATPATTLDDLTRAVSDYVLTDIEQQLRLADQPFATLRELPAHRRVCGPCFTGSADLGGADADFILDGLLLDCKASINPRDLGRNEVYQLAGYLLLDYDNHHDINQVGIYLSRQGAFITWQVDDFLTKLGAQTTLTSLRQEMRQHLNHAQQATHAADTRPSPPAAEIEPPSGKSRDSIPSLLRRLFKSD